jgi:hypothetical protein
MCKMTPFKDTPSLTAPLTRIHMFFAFFLIKVCVTSTCSTSKVPILNTRAPKVPCIEVCESLQTTVVSGNVNLEGKEKRREKKVGSFLFLSFFFTFFLLYFFLFYFFVFFSYLVPLFWVYNMDNSLSLVLHSKVSNVKVFHIFL